MFMVSVIVPVLEDEQALARLLGELCADQPVLQEVEILVVDGGSARQTGLRDLERLHPGVQWLRTMPGRGRQMNAAAARARGRWLVFVHADTVLEAGWLDELRRAATDPAVVGGAFRFALDSIDWRARLVEWGVACRVAWFGLPYGDQAIFVRRDIFHALGGYAELPLMEDVELIRRLAHTGRLAWPAARAITSARRWERDGWIRRTAGNLVLILRYFTGTPPAKLADAYWGPPGERRVGAAAGRLVRPAVEPPTRHSSVL